MKRTVDQGAWRWASFPVWADDYEAFDIGPDSELYLPPGQRVSIW